MATTRTRAALLMRLLRTCCSVSAARDGRNPRAANTAMPAKAMAARFVRKSNSAPPATSQRPKATPIPMVHSGGMRAVAIATPGSAAERAG